MEQHDGRCTASRAYTRLLSDLLGRIVRILLDGSSLGPRFLS